MKRGEGGVGVAASAPLPVLRGEDAGRQVRGSATAMDQIALGRSAGMSATSDAVCHGLGASVAASGDASAGRIRRCASARQRLRLCRWPLPRASPVRRDRRLRGRCGSGDRRLCDRQRDRHRRRHVEERLPLAGCARCHQTRSGAVRKRRHHFRADRRRNVKGSCHDRIRDPPALPALAHPAPFFARSTRAGSLPPSGRSTWCCGVCTNCCDCRIRRWG